MTVDIQGLGKITASKETLNMLSIYLGVAPMKNVTKLESFREGALHARDAIYEALNNSGYYSN